MMGPAYLLLQVAVLFVLALGAPGAEALSGLLSQHDQRQLASAFAKALGIGSDTMKGKRQFPSWVNNSCADIGGASACNNAGGSCESGTTFCNPGLYCDDTNSPGVCAAKTLVSPPADCSADGVDCVAGADCEEVSGGREECRWDGLEGNKCCFGESTDYRCWSNASCVDTEISIDGDEETVKTCPFTPNGGSCTDSDQCDVNSYCAATGLCTAEPGVGQACGLEIGDSFADKCGGVTPDQLVLCRKSDTTCQVLDEAAIKTIANGQPCTDNYLCQSFYCASGTCQARPTQLPGVTVPAGGECYPFASFAIQQGLSGYTTGCPANTLCLCGTTGNSLCIDENTLESPTQQTQDALQAYQIGDCTAEIISYAKCSAKNPQCPSSGQKGSCCCAEHKAFEECSFTARNLIFPQFSAPYCGGFASDPVTCVDNDQACTPLDASSAVHNAAQGVLTATLAGLLLA